MQALRVDPIKHVTVCAFCECQEGKMFIVVAKHTMYICFECAGEVAEAYHDAIYED